MFKYPASYARMRGLKGKLAGKSYLESFLGASDTKAIVSALGQTVYSEHLREAGNISLVEHGLKQDMVLSYIKLLTFMRGRSARFVRALLDKFELLNLKSIIRSIVNRSITGESVKPFIFPLGKYHTIGMEEALEVDDLTELVELMGKTPFARPMEIGYQRYEEDGKLFPIELALDLDYYERQWQALKALGPIDRINAGRLMGIQYDITNLVWIFRFKEYYSFTSEQIFQYIIPHGWHIRGDTFREIASSDNLEEAVASIQVSPYDDLLTSVSPVDGSFILGVELHLKRYLYRAGLEIFIKFPLQAAQLIAFFICKEMEINDIVTILAGKNMELPQERIRPYMITL